MRILALPGSMPGHGSTDYRIVYPLRHLERQFGIEYKLAPKTSLNELDQYDLVLFQRQEIGILGSIMQQAQISPGIGIRSPWVAEGMAWTDEQRIAASHRVGKKVLFDIDDDAFNIPFHNPNYLLWGKDHQKIAEIIARLAAANRGNLPEYLQGQPPVVAAQARNNLKNLLRNIGAADALVVSTSWLSEVYSRQQKRRYILPNYAEPEEFDGIGPESHDGVHIGWAGGPTHFDDLRIIAGPIRQIMEEHPQTTLVLVGYPAIVEFLFGQIPEDRIIVYPFERGKWRKRLSTFDIILAPSADNKFNRGKSVIRIYQGLLATRGRAAVVGSETTYGNALRRLRCGYVCKNTRDWLRSLRRLIEDSSMREKMGTTGYDRMMVSETYEVNAYKWMDVFEEVLSSR